MSNSDATAAAERDDRAPLPRRYLSLFHRVAAINAVLLILGVVVTIVILVPGHESSYKIDVEGAALLVAVILVVLLNAFLLRRIVQPVQRLTALARTVDLTDPRPPVLGDAEPNSEAGELALTFNDMLLRLQSERRQTTSQVLAGQEAERMRIAQELHDQVGQDLTAALLLLSRLHSEAPEDLQGAVLGAQDSVRAGLEDVRRIAIELRPEALDDLGLESALAVLCDRFAKRTGLQVSLDIAEPLPALSPDAELVIYRVTQEALTNIARHSRSERAELSLHNDDAQIVLTVRDHGRGLEHDYVPGSGIRGMRERAGLIGAALEVRDHPGGGCEVRLQFPVGAAA